jgi:hypothetical protein
MEQTLEANEVHLSDIEYLRNNAAWRWVMFEWEEILDELEVTLISEDYPNVYRTQGRVSVLIEVLKTLDRLEDLVREQRNGS